MAVAWRMHVTASLRHLALAPPLLPLTAISHCSFLSDGAIVSVPPIFYRRCGRCRRSFGSSFAMCALACRFLRPAATCTAAAVRRRNKLPRSQPAGGWLQHQQRRVTDGGSSVGTDSAPRPPGRGPVTLAASARDDLLRGVDAENRDAVARIVEQAQRAADSWTIVYSDFHTPPVVADAMMVLEASRLEAGPAMLTNPRYPAALLAAQCMVLCIPCAPSNPGLAHVFLQRMADVAAVPWGGYPQAERCRCGAGALCCTHPRQSACRASMHGPAQQSHSAAEHEI